MLGIDQLDPHASSLRLVGDKLPQLVKSPSRHAGALRLAKPDASPDALEVFEGDTPDSAFSLLNDTLGEDVIGVSTEVGFFERASMQLLADALAAARILGLIRRRLKALAQRLALFRARALRRRPSAVDRPSPSPDSPRRGPRRGSRQDRLGADRRIRP